jgi:hypothetical protein
LKEDAVSPARAHPDSGQCSVIASGMVHITIFRHSECLVPVSKVAAVRA